jgi:hypothetical protein
VVTTSLIQQNYIAPANPIIGEHVNMSVFVCLQHYAIVSLPSRISLGTPIDASYVSGLSSWGFFMRSTFVLSLTYNHESL